MVENLDEAVKFLIEKSYITLHNGKYKFTSLFYKELTGIQKGLTAKGVVEEPNLPARREFNVALAGNYTLADWREHYLTFIKVAKVPATLRAGLSTYSVNKYSEEGMKVFQSAIKEGYKLELLIAAVRLYYNDSTGYKKSIGNYMKDGDWRTDYITIKESAEQGSIMELIKEKTKPVNPDGYRIG